MYLFEYKYGQSRWKVLTVYVIKTRSSFGNLKMDANEGVQSFNFEVRQNFKSFKEFESQLKHYLMFKKQN